MSFSTDEYVDDDLAAAFAVSLTINDIPENASTRSTRTCSHDDEILSRPICTYPLTVKLLNYAMINEVPLVMIYSTGAYANRDRVIQPVKWLEGREGKTFQATINGGMVLNYLAEKIKSLRTQQKIKVKQGSVSVALRSPTSTSLASRTVITYNSSSSPKSPSSSTSSTTSSSTTSSDSSSTLCVVCLDKSRSVLFLPCKHCNCCTACTKNIDKCPLCRANIRQKVEIYL